MVIVKNVIVSSILCVEKWDLLLHILNYFELVFKLSDNKFWKLNW